MDESPIFSFKIEQNHSSPITKFVTDLTNILFTVEHSRPQGLMHEDDWKQLDGDVRLVGRGVRDLLAIAPRSKDEWPDAFER